VEPCPSGSFDIIRTLPASRPRGPGPPCGREKYTLKFSRKNWVSHEGVTPRTIDFRLRICYNIHVVKKERRKERERKKKKQKERKRKKRRKKETVTCL
jgi:hypothetical protein